MMGGTQYAGGMNRNTCRSSYKVSIIFAVTDFNQHIHGVTISHNVLHFMKILLTILSLLKIRE
jgi:hypothetical protein